MKTILSTILISLPLLLVGCNGNKKDKSCETELATCKAECKEKFPVGDENPSAVSANIAVCNAVCETEKDECEEKLKGKSKNDDEEETAKEDTNVNNGSVVKEGDASP